MRWLPLLGIACVAEGDVVKAPWEPLDTSFSQTTGSATGTPGDTGATTDTGTAPCPAHMALVDGPGGAFCIDRYEAALEGWSPYEVPPLGRIAVTGPGVMPQGYISADVAADACANAGKRLCAAEEWLAACQGDPPTTFPYGDAFEDGACNTGRASHPVVDLFGAATDWSMTQMNDPRINQQPDTVDAGGQNPTCESAAGVFDLHGNLHEWVDDPDGTFRGGFYVDGVLNGPGCTYATTAHGTSYHDYSTGFRCCAEAW